MEKNKMKKSKIIALGLILSTNPKKKKFSLNRKFLFELLQEISEYTTYKWITKNET